MTLFVPAESRLGAPGWREFFDLLSDAVVVFDRSASIVLANTAALRLLPCEAGMSPDHLQAALGRDAVQWLKRAMAGDGGGSSGGVNAIGRVGPGGDASTLRVLLGTGRNAQLTWRRLDGQHGALHLVPDDASLVATLPLSGHVVNTASHPAHPASWRQGAGLRDAAGVFWDSPFPASFQGPDFRLIDVNQAFVEFSGYTRAQLIGLTSARLNRSGRMKSRAAARICAGVTAASRSRVRAAGMSSPWPMSCSPSQVMCGSVPSSARSNWPMT